jgi:hypothetical protein
MQHCTVHLLVIPDFEYRQNSASGGVNMSFSDHKCLYFVSRLLSLKDIEYLTPPKYAPCRTEYFIYRAQNYVFIIGGLNGVNHLGKTGT